MTSRTRKILCAPWALLGRLPVAGRPALEVARWLAGRYKERRFLASLFGGPWISPRACVRLPAGLRCGRNVFIDDQCVLFAESLHNDVRLGDGVSLYLRTIIHAGGEGSVEIGSGTHIQNDCQITAFGRISIGSNVQVAPRCAFYPYGHGFADSGTPILSQPLVTKGGITIEDDVWLGYGVIVLDGVTIGRGAVVGAGSVVTKNLPAGAIAAGAPARVVRMRPGWNPG